MSATETIDRDSLPTGQLNSELPLWALVREDWIAHGRDWSLPGFRAVALCRFGQWRMGIRSKFVRAPFSLLYRYLYRHVRNCYGIELPYTVELGRRVVVEHQSGIFVHGSCRIGDDCVLRQGVTLGNRREEEPAAVPMLGNRVVIGAGAKIIGRVFIGDGAQIGANAVVLKNVPAGALAVGVPAKIVERAQSNIDERSEAEAVPITVNESIPLMSDAEVAHSVGIVVIGRNEGPRLERCLRSVAMTGCPVVYVDSGSTDGSVAVARSHGADVVELSVAESFTAARGRNAGWRRLVEVRPELEFVQFIDGDCELCSGWLAAAAQYGKEHPDVSVICGRRREIDPERNIFHRWTDMEWDTSIGEAAYCGGDALVRRMALEKVNGYRDDLIAGEEPEMCVRIRDAGGKVWRLDHDMTRHDIDIRSFSQWWRRSVRSGYAYAEGAALHGAPPKRHWTRESRSIWIWGAAIPVAALILALPTHGASLVFAALAYIVLFVKILWQRALERTCPIASAATFAAMCVVMKWPQAVGQILYWNRRLRRTPAEIIEYDRKPSQPETGKFATRT